MKKNILIIVLLIVICCMVLEIYNINKKEVSNTIIEQNQSEKKYPATDNRSFSDNRPGYLPF